MLLAIAILVRKISFLLISLIGLNYGFSATIVSLFKCSATFLALKMFVYVMDYVLIHRVRFSLLCPHRLPLFGLRNNVVLCLRKIVVGGLLFWYELSFLSAADCV